MAERRSPLQHIHRTAVDALAAELRAEGASPSPRRRDDESDAWTVPCDAVLDVPHLVIATDHDFPFSWPRVYLPDASQHLRWPHVEHDGRLCLHTPTDEPPCAVIPGLGRTELMRAKDLIVASASGMNQGDFVGEFERYWLSGTPGREVLLLGAPAIARHTAAALLFGRLVAVADEKDRLLSWARSFLGNVPKGARIIPAVIARLKQPLVPPYPSDLRSLMGLLEKQSEVGDAVARRLDGTNAILPVILAFDGPLGETAGACIVDLSRAAQQSLRRGVRARALTAARVKARAPKSGATVMRSRVQRVDADWLHSRGGSHDLHRFVRDRVVTLVGCGSLGAPVALMLAHAGIGELHLIDPDALSWNNVGRHPLGGARSLYANKAHALRDEIRRRLPHLDVQAHDAKWQDVYRRRPEMFEEVDLIVSTTGSWSCDAALSTLSRTRLDPPVLFGWSEAHGVAGHALLVRSLGGCLHCGMAGDGRFAFEATEWKNEAPVRQEPGCGAFYSPMGASDLMPIASMIATAALEALTGQHERSLHRTWLGPSSRLLQLGGQWAGAWSSAYGEPGDGERVHAAAWKIGSRCRLCRRGSAARAA